MKNYTYKMKSLAERLQNALNTHIIYTVKGATVTKGAKKVFKDFIKKYNI